MPIVDELTKIKDAQAAFVASLDIKYGTQAVVLQQKLIDMINSELLTNLTIVDGQVVNSPENYRTIYNFENIWQDYSDAYFTPAVQSIATDALKVTAFSNQYFKQLGITGSNATQLLTASAQNIDLMMGIERVGKQMQFIPGGYMDRLLQGAEVRDTVMSVLTDSVSVKTGFKELYSTMQDAVSGSDQVDGVMQQYFRGYVYDTFSGVQSAYDNYVGEAAGMNSFVYAGTIIKTTREFCREHVGGVFTRKDIEAWRDMDWQGKNWDAPFEVARGGYNCRHDLRWIPDELINEFK